VDGDRLQWIACISAPLEIARRHINEEILAIILLCLDGQYPDS
jgi:hypothetical protein